jgi:hypothetical protein
MFEYVSFFDSVDSFAYEVETTSADYKSSLHTPDTADVMLKTVYVPATEL